MTINAIKAASEFIEIQLNQFQTTDKYKRKGKLIKFQFDYLLIIKNKIFKIQTKF